MKLEIPSNKTKPNNQQYLKSRTIIDSMPNDFRKISRILSIPSHEVRLKILFLINTENELTTTDLADILRMSVPAVSHHISKIKSLGIIKARKEGSFLYYSLNEDETNILSNVFNFIKLEKEKLINLPV